MRFSLRIKRSAVEALQAVPKACGACVLATAMLFIAEFPDESGVFTSDQLALKLVSGCL